MHKLKKGLIKLIAHASKALLPAQKNYFGIEKENLGIVFALKKFIDSFPDEGLPYKQIACDFLPQKGLPIHTTKTLPRYGTILLNYDFRI